MYQITFFRPPEKALCNSYWESFLIIKNDFYLVFPVPPLPCRLYAQSSHSAGEIEFPASIPVS